MPVWTEWPISRRQSPPGGPASEMNEAFFADWHDRDENLRARVTPGDNLSAKVLSPTFGIWTAIGTSSRVWIPQWAKALIVRCSMAAQMHGPTDPISSNARPKLGTVYGSVMSVNGDGTLDPPPTSNQSAIVIPDAMRDTEQTFTYEVRSNAGGVDWIWVFNDARDATYGYKHRHWLFVEA